MWRFRTKKWATKPEDSGKDNDSSNESSSLAEDDSGETPESSSEQEEPVLNDESSSLCSSFSSEEKVRMAQKRSKRMEETYQEEAVSRFGKKTKSKKKLDFCSPSKKSPMKVIVAVKCSVVVPRMRKAPRDSTEPQVIPETQDDVMAEMFAEDAFGGEEIQETPVLPCVGGGDVNLVTPFRFVEGCKVLQETVVEDTPLGPGGKFLAMSHRVPDVIPLTVAEGVVGLAEIPKTQGENSPLSSGGGEAAAVIRQPPWVRVGAFGDADEPPRNEESGTWK